MLFYQARCAPSPNDHRSHIFPYLLCYVTMVPAHSILHEAFALGGTECFSKRKCVVILLIHSKTEEGKVSFGRIIRPCFTKFLGEFQGCTHACALACDKS